MEEYAGEEYLSGEVKQFIKYLNKSLQGREVYDTQSLYQGDFQSLTDRYFKASPWPTADSVSSVVDHDPNFLILYKELYFRHIYAKLSPSVDDRLDSFENYVKLFNILISLNTEEPELELPAVWIWDIIDEFVSQFCSFHKYRTHVPSNKHEVLADELQTLKDNEHHWSAQSVIKYLYTLSKKAGIAQNKHQTTRPQTSPMFKSVGEFTQIGLARVHVLLGDYTSALQALDKINMSPSDPMSFTRVLGCNVTTQYIMGVSFMMLKRYSDAIECFASFLGQHSRRKGGLKPHQEDTVNNMYGLLAICMALSPGSIEPTLEKMLRDKYGEKLNKMAQGDTSVFEEIFYDNCPRYITARAPDYDKDMGLHKEAANLQVRVFVNEMRQQSGAPAIESCLKLCTATTLKKLGEFTKNDNEDAMMADLLAIRASSLELKRSSTSDQPTSGSWTTQGARTPFYIDGNVVHVADPVPVQRYGQTFISNIMKYEDLIADVRHIGL